MADFDQTDDIDALIDKAVDTFFVEAPSEDELAFEGEESEPAPPPPPPPPVPAPPAPRTTDVDTRGETPGGGPSLEEAVESLFMEAFDAGEEVDVPEPEPSRAFARTPTVITSGDDETDRAIDLAVDTLFIEEPEADAPPPETARLEVTEVRPGIPSEEPVHDVVTPAEKAPPPRKPAPPPTPAPKPPPPPPRPAPKPAPPPRPAPPRPPAPPAAPEEQKSYDDVMALEIERHMDTLFEAKAPAPAPREKRAPAEAVAPQRERVPARPQVSPLRKLQEAILTLEWEISKRSIKTLAVELQRVRSQYQDNVTVDFAAMSMRIVLDYIVKRMAKAHPESIRFLLEVTDYLDRSLTTSEQDPLGAFHRILTRYESYKSMVRKAEGLPDRKPPILHELGISDPDMFSRLVEGQGKTLIRAGYSLAKRIGSSQDPETLIRSFRFLVNRSVSRILESTQRDSGPRKAGKPSKKKVIPKTTRA